MRVLKTLFAVAGLLGAVGAQAADFSIDPTHTFATFEIDHFGTTTNRGRFDRKQGTVFFDRLAGIGKVDVTVDTASVSTGTPAFDRVLRGEDLLDVERHPTARFVSDQFFFSGDKVSEVQGQLTLRGQTRPVTFKARKFNCYNSPVFKRIVCGGDFEAEIDRTAFGMDYGVIWDFSKTVRLVLQVEAIKQ